MPQISKKKTKKTVDEPTNTIPFTIEPVVLQLSLSQDKIETIVKADELKQTAEPAPYYPENSFAHDSSILKHDVESQHKDLCCFWCCHKIEHTEYSMPIRYDALHNNFTTYGSFCSFECVAAYNISINSGCDRLWEIHSWIQLLAQKYGYELPIRPAPSRYLLKMFNGPLTIQEFRQAHKTLDKTYVANIPPLIHVASHLDCLNTSFLEKQPLIKKKKSTIDQKMNLFIENDI